MKSSNPTATQKATRVFVVDDHPFLRDGIVNYLNQQQRYVCCGAAESVSAALAAITEQQPDCAILDLRLKDGDGLTLLKAIRQHWPNLPVLIFSQMDESVFALRCLRAGANGFLPKQSGPQELVAALDQIMAGQLHVGQSVHQLLLREAIDFGASRLGNSQGINALSDRELEVLSWVGKGARNKEMAEGLDVSPKTIETHRENMKLKLGLRSAAELFDYAKKWVESGEGADTLGPP